MRCPPTLTDVPRSHTRSRPQGAVPFFVSATSGTTVLGAFDPLGPVADVCQRHGLWLHVDVSAQGDPAVHPQPRFPAPTLLCPVGRLGWERTAFQEASAAPCRH